MDDFVSGVAILIVLLSLAYYARKDVDRRGGPGWLVAVLIVVIAPIGIAYWLGLRGVAAPGKMQRMKDRQGTEDPRTAPRDA